MAMQKKVIYLFVLTIILTVILLWFFYPTPAPDYNTAKLPENALPDVENVNAQDETDVEQPVTVEPPRFGIYSGKGSWKDNVDAIKNFLDYYDFDWIEIDEQEVSNFHLKEHFDIIWFPGGFAAEYKNFIPVHSNIRSFIEQGGSFIGSCAGAYYAADILRWQGSDFAYPLKLFAGKSIGPLSGLIPWGDTAVINLEHSHPVNQGFASSIEMYYFDGPYFAPYDPDSVEVIARYAVNDRPAVIAFRYGEGRVLLFGPHPELGRAKLDAQNINVSGGEGAQWPWLFSTLQWFSLW